MPWDLSLLVDTHRVVGVQMAKFSDAVTDPCQPLNSQRNDSYDSLFSLPCTLKHGENITAKVRTIIDN